MKVVLTKTSVALLRSSPVSQHDCPVPERSSTVVIDGAPGEYAPHSSAAAPCGENFHAMLAAREAVHLLAHRTHATAGLILLDRDGNPGFAFNTPRMAYGIVAPDGPFFTPIFHALVPAFFA